MIYGDVPIDKLPLLFIDFLKHKIYNRVKYLGKMYFNKKKQKVNKNVFKKARIARIQIVCR